MADTNYGDFLDQRGSRVATADDLKNWSPHGEERVFDEDTAQYTKKKPKTNGTNPEWGWHQVPKCRKCGGEKCWQCGMSHACLQADGSYKIDDKRPVGSEVKLPPLPWAELAELESLLDVVRLDSVVRKNVEWLWPGKIPRGMITTFAGQPGAGKSTHTIWMGATCTMGRDWPDGTGTAPTGDVAYLSSEDSLEHTIGPRMDAAYGDSSKVFFIRASASIDPKTGKRIERAVRFDQDMEKIDAFLTAHPGVVALFVDPISEYLGEADSHKNAAVRAVLAPLAKLAEKHRIAIVIVTHFAKGAGGPALYKAMGSLAFVALSRAAWAFVPDHEDPDRVLFLPLKMNVAKRPPGLAYRIHDTGTGYGQLVWETGDVTISADEAMNALNEPKKRDKLAEAEAWLLQRLADGSEVESDALVAEAKEAGIAFATFKRAKQAAGVKSRKGRHLESGKWFVSLPREPVETDEIVEPLEPVEPLTDFPLFTEEVQESQEAQEVQEAQESHGKRNGISPPKHATAGCTATAWWLCNNGRRYCAKCQPPLSETVVVDRGEA